MRSGAERICELLEAKLALTTEQQRRKTLLATGPRESLRVALQDEMRQVDAQILRLDEEFNAMYADYRAALPLRADGSIDTAALAPADRRELLQIRELVRKIASTAFQTTSDTVR